MEGFRDFLRAEIERSHATKEEKLEGLYTLRQFILSFEEQYGARDRTAYHEVVAEIYKLENS